MANGDTGTKKFTTGEGRTVVPTSEYLSRLTIARMQIDIMGAETVMHIPILIFQSAD